ncbi:MAG: AraC family transcriptional regulator [Chloroflexota bacterium]|nr:AraC family transcriptional regulator [Chloroflexota bacterium]
MPDRRSTLSFETSLVRVFEVDCRAPRSAFGHAEWAAVTQIVLPRRGAFVVEQGGDTMVAHAATAVVLPVDGEYRVSHPVTGGDVCTVLVFIPALLEEALGRDTRRHGPLRPRTQLGLRLLVSSLATADGLEAEEASLLLLHAVSRDLAESSVRGQRLGRLPRARVEQVRALLATRPAAQWRLQTVAHAVDCSPFHLARQFRTATGESISRYLVRLRLAVALERIADGEHNLTSLALDLGFAHHSHFSARFRDVFGMTPSRARETLARRRLDEMRTIVIADAPHAS